MILTNGILHFEGNERDIWEKLLQRKLGAISPHLLRELGQARVKELMDEGCVIWARMATQQLLDIPMSLH